jgi:hypothetical protein
MPALKQLVNVIVPIQVAYETAEGQVVINASYSMRAFAQAEIEKQDSQQPIPVLLRVLVDWDVTDDEGNPLPITEETLKLLPWPVLNDLFHAILEDALEERRGKRVRRGSGSSARA